MNITAETQNNRPASLVDWSMAPAWVDFDHAAFLLGVDAATIEKIVGLGGVDAIERDGKTLVERDGLREFWEIYHDAIGADD